ncbi:MAG: tRNA 2-thiocytidine biosynthesis protein TtcA [Clostridia bacterium]|nr:tRNA 2-thiocytidine biosynthesis protein TtcA [Clostridia bacterium]
MKELTRQQEIERSIITTFRTRIWAKFLDGVIHYSLVEDGDNIAVCVSGGKDSFLLAKLMQELKKHYTFHFNLHFISMDPGYSEANAAKIRENAEILGVPLEIFHSNIFRVAERKGGDSPCYLCSRMRRGFLYARAKELGCNKIALGHNKSDVIETTLMGMFYGGQLQGMLPKLHAQNFDNMTLIRPMYEVLEDDIVQWKEYNHLSFIACACKKTAMLPEGVQGDSARQTMKSLVHAMRKENPDVEASLFKALHNVQIETFPAYNANGSLHFMEKFREEELQTELRGTKLPVQDLSSPLETTDSATDTPTEPLEVNPGTDT